MWEFFIRNTRFSYFLIASLLFFGVYSLQTIPKESAPEVQIPVGVVSTVLPGASALEIESLITNELERGLSGTLSDVSSITSTSRESISTIIVEFSARADIDQSIRQLKDEVDRLAPRLPNDAETPVVTEIDFVDQPILTVAIAGQSAANILTALADAVSDELEQVSGVSRVEAVGVSPREVSVLVTPESLARFDLTVDQVVDGLRAANTSFPVGQIITDNTIVNIAFLGDITDTNEIANIPVAARGGQPVYVRDIATIVDDVAVARSISRLSIAGAPSETSFSLDVYKTRGGDITAITAAVRDAVTELQSSNGLLADYDVFVVQDSGEQIRSDLVSLSQSGLITVVLVVLLLVVAIGWREGLIAGTAIPLSFMIGFIGLYLSGNTINFISTFSLILGIGILVDSGIVMVEGINKRMKDDPSIDKIQAAILTVRAFAGPITAGTLTTVSMFAGLFIVSGVTGQFIASIPFTLISILFASLLVALGFLPLIASSFLKRQSKTRLEQLQTEYARRAEAWYRSKLLSFLQSTRAVVIFFVLIVVGFVSSLALIPIGFVQVVFFGESDGPAVFVEIELPEGSTIADTDRVARQVEDILYTYRDDVSAFTTTVGAGSVFGAGGQNEKLANHYLVMRDDSPLGSTALLESLRAELATLPVDATISVSQLSAGPPTGAPIGVSLLGDDLTELSRATDAVAELIRDIPETTNVTTSNTANSTELTLTYDRSVAAALGLNPRIVSQTLRAAVTGTEATSITSLSDSIDVVVRLQTQTDNPYGADTRYMDIADVRNVPITTQTGAQVPVSSVASVGIREATNAIQHDDQERVMTVSADITSTGNVREINQAIADRLAARDVLPAGITYRLGGETEDSDQAFGELFLALVVGILLMFAVLILQFNSYRYTFYVLSILPFSLIGILYGLAITGSSLSFPSIMGFIALTGIVVNNSILLIDMMNTLRRERPEADILTIVVDAATNRLRPIVLTTLTTVVGLSPLLFSDPIWVPLATAIIFGLSFSVVITLLLIPAIYYLWPGKMRG